MTLTDKLGIVADCFPDSRGEPDMKRLESANVELFNMIRNSKDFPTIGTVRVLDIGSGMKGSDFVQRYEREFPNTQIVYLDSARFLLEELKKSNKVHADATLMPFPDESFNIAYAGHIISDGIVKNHHIFKNDESYKIAKEGYRVIKQGGLFIFTYCIGDDRQTLDNLSEIGFRKVEHLQRIKWYAGIPTDTYAAMR